MGSVPYLRYGKGPKKSPFSQMKLHATLIYFVVTPATDLRKLYDQGGTFLWQTATTTQGVISQQSAEVTFPRSPLAHSP